MSPPKSAQKSRGFPKSIPIPFRTNAESCKAEAEAEAKAEAEDRVAKTFALSKAEAEAKAVADTPALTSCVGNEVSFTMADRLIDRDLRQRLAIQEGSLRFPSVV